MSSLRHHPSAEVHPHPAPAADIAAPAWERLSTSAHRPLLQPTAAADRTQAQSSPAIPDRKSDFPPAATADSHFHLREETSPASAAQAEAPASAAVTAPAAASLGKILAQENQAASAALTPALTPASRLLRDQAARAMPRQAILRSREFPSTVATPSSPCPASATIPTPTFPQLRAVLIRRSTATSST